MIPAIVIPNWHPPTCNQLFRGRLKMRIRLGKDAREMIGYYALKAQVPHATGKRRVTLWIILGPRQRGSDVDAYWKATLDALKAARLIVDDSRQWCELAPVQFDYADEKRTEIVLEEKPC